MHHVVSKVSMTRVAYRRRSKGEDSRVEIESWSHHTDSTHNIDSPPKSQSMSTTSGKPHSRLQKYVSSTIDSRFLLRYCMTSMGERYFL